MSLPLTGLGVLVTRPVHQAGGFIAQLQAAGATAFALPAIEITPLALNAITQQQLLAQRYQLIIFISANAVLYGLSTVRPLTNNPQTKITAIGHSTAQKLQEQGVSIDIIAASGHTSEDLLKLPTLQTAVTNGSHILIVRGKGGRELLATTLQQRGAHVDYAEVYTRNCPQTNTQWINNLWHNQLHIICVTSNVILENLYHMLQHNSDPLLKTTLLVPGDRCQQLAQTLGFKKIIQASSAGDNDMLQRILQWQQTGA